MPTSITSTSNYTGKAAGAIIGASFKEADTISKGLVTVLENVNYQEHLRRIRYSDGRVAYACGFTPAGSIVINERTVTPVKLKIDLELCKETFRNQWGESLMGASASNPNLGSDIQQAMLAEVLAENAEEVDYMIWNGDNSANSNEWDGYIKQFQADGDVIVATSALKVGAAVTKSNVVSGFEAATALVPIALRRKPLIFAVSPDVALAYTQYLIANGLSNGLGGNANTSLQYGLYQLTIVNGLPANTIVIYERKNLVFATGLLGDHNTVAMKDMDDFLLDGMVRLKMVFNGGVNYYNSEDIVYFNFTANP